MKKRNTRYLLYTTLLGMLVSVSGCSSVLPIDSGTPAAVTTAPTQAPDSQVDDNLLYTSDNGELTITLPGKNWVNTADDDFRRTFLADETGILTISHYLNDYADTVAVPKTQAELESLLLTRPTIAEVSGSAFTAVPHTVMNFSYQPGNTANSYFYELSYNEGNKVRYEIVWGMQASGEIYEVVGKLYTADQDAADKLRVSIQSTSITDSNYVGIVRSSGSYAADHAGTDSAGAIQYRCIQSANVRDQASAGGSKVIGELSVGDTVNLIAEVNGWIEFEYNGQTAYVYSEYMELVSTPDSDTAPKE